MGAEKINRLQYERKNIDPYNMHGHPVRHRADSRYRHVSPPERPDSRPLPHPPPKHAGGGNDVSHGIFPAPGGGAPRLFQALLRARMVGHTLARRGPARRREAFR